MIFSSLLNDVQTTSLMPPYGRFSAEISFGKYLIVVNYLEVLKIFVLNVISTKVFKKFTLLPKKRTIFAFFKFEINSYCSHVPIL